MYYVLQSLVFQHLTHYPLQHYIHVHVAVAIHCHQYKAVFAAHESFMMRLDSQQSSGKPQFQAS